ncbi:hypothetical protein INT48_006688 [Thamnidium elegans]|uniref:GIY-YIG domain-containing protein n=1 Tax=Thamnidium elegans TaxID=101142 RepID=A0A8H7SLV1_9FUNG|nr:hypothetical protein INT48_006688 [Thamnidium elegans]
MSYCSFYSCYLIRSLQEGHTNKTYVGSTPDPIRRLRQHNGELTQGAYRTRKLRPWEHILVIYGFPSRKHALQFECAWQKPLQSRHTKCIANTDIFKARLKSCRGLNSVMTKVRAAQLLLNTSPFSLLPLKLRFVLPTMQSMFLDGISLPKQISWSVGPIQDLVKQNRIMDYVLCDLCNDMNSHVRCLSKDFSDQGIPVYGYCPNCAKLLVWGDLIKASKLRNKLVEDGISFDLDQEPSNDSSSNMDSSDSDSSVINLT